jgi:hypothetical protein
MYVLVCTWYVVCTGTCNDLLCLNCNILNTYKSRKTLLCRSGACAELRLARVARLIGHDWNLEVNCGCERSTLNYISVCTKYVHNTYGYILVCAAIYHVRLYTVNLEGLECSMWLTVLGWYIQQSSDSLYLGDIYSKALTRCTWVIYTAKLQQWFTGCSQNSIDSWKQYTTVCFCMYWFIRVHVRNIAMYLYIPVCTNYIHVCTILPNLVHWHWYRIPDAILVLLGYSG